MRLGGSSTRGSVNVGKLGFSRANAWHAGQEALAQALIESAGTHSRELLFVESIVQLEHPQGKLSGQCRVPYG